jgi:uncharacterized protein YecE (DUF72 family)
MRKIEASGAREAWIYFDNDREGFAIKNAQTLSGLLRERGHEIKYQGAAASRPPSLKKGGLESAPP